MILPRGRVIVLLLCALSLSFGSAVCCVGLCELRGGVTCVCARLSGCVLRYVLSLGYCAMNIQRAR